MVTHSQVGGSSSHRPAARGAKRPVRSEERPRSSKVSDELSTPRGAESLPDDDSDEIYVLRDVPARAAAKSERRAARLTDELMIHTCAVFERDLARLRGSGSARSEFLPEKPAAQTSNRAAAPPVDARVQCDRAKAPRKGDCPSRSADAAYRRNFVFSRDRPGGSPAACGVSPNSVSCRKMEGSFAAESVKGAEKAKCVTGMPREVAVSPRCAVHGFGATGDDPGPIASGSETSKPALRATRAVHGFGAQGYDPGTDVNASAALGRAAQATRAVPGFGAFGDDPDSDRDVAETANRTACAASAVHGLGETDGDPGSLVDVTDAVKRAAFVGQRAHSGGASSNDPERVIPDPQAVAVPKGPAACSVVEIPVECVRRKCVLSIGFLGLFLSFLVLLMLCSEASASGYVANPRVTRVVAPPVCSRSVVRRWGCWILGVNRWCTPCMAPDGTDMVTGNFPCDTVECHVHRVSTNISETFSLMMTNPFLAWIRLLSFLTTGLSEKVAWFIRVCGFLTIVLALNVGAYMLSRVADFLAWMSKVLSLSLHMPLVVLAVRLIKMVWRMLTSLAQSEKDLEKKRTDKNGKVAHLSNAPEKSDGPEPLEAGHSQSGRECERDTIPENVEVSNTQILEVLRQYQKALEHRQEVSNLPAVPSPRSGKFCEYCGKMGHDQTGCRRGRVEDRSKGVTRQFEGRSTWRPMRDDNELQDWEEPEGSGPKSLLYTPIKINGTKLPRCLIDTGAAINLMPVSEVTKHGWTYQPGDIKFVRGFNGAASPVIGAFTCKMQFGPMQEPKEADFLVVKETKYPIIGIDTLKSLGITVNCRDHELQDVSTGRAVRCAVISFSKNCGLR